MQTGLIEPSIISFTGVDTYTDFNDLQAIYLQYPNIEFGVSFYGNSPIIDMIERNSRLPWVLHLAEPVVNSLFKQANQYDFKVIPWQRIQFNIDWNQIPCNADTINKIQQISTAICQEAKVIIHENSTVRNVLKNIVLPNNVHVLSDVSGGSGISPSEHNSWTSPYHDYFGFAGGIGPQNFMSVIHQISQLLNEKDSFYWIDMESSLRCNQTKHFDTKKVKAILEALTALRNI